MGLFQKGPYIFLSLPDSFCLANIVGQLLLVALGIETVEHVVVVNGGVGADGFKTAVMIGEDQSVGTHHDSRAIAGEVDHGAADGVAALIEVGIGQGETFLLHGVVDRL